MKIDRICINNFRSLKNVALNLNNLTMIIGSNGTGKTAMLDALGLFEHENANVVKRDFNEPKKEIELILVLSDVKEPIKAPEFIVKNTLTIKKSFKLEEDKPTSHCEVYKTCYAQFNEIRGAETRQRAAKFKAIGKNFKGFPEYSAAWEEDLNRFEYEYIKDHPENKGEERFVNWKPAQMSLGDILNIVHVPAMKDITADGEEGTDSNLTKLIGMAVRENPEVNDHLEEIEKEFVEKYDDYLPTIHEKVLDPINANLKETTAGYVNNAKFTIDISTPKPKSLALRASTTITEDDHPTDIKHVGSGVQRIYLIAILEAIAEQRSKKPIKKKTDQETKQKTKEAEYTAPAKLIMIDEPELYQHPQRQRHILKQFEKLTKGKNAIQMACSTHSPYFVEMQNIDNIRLVQKKLKNTKIQSTTLNQIIKYMDVNHPDTLDPETRLRRWLDMSATHWATEGFFSKLVVVVEGFGDRNMLLTVASALNVDLNKNEISIVPCNGKKEIPRLGHMFMQFQIQVYFIWDLDLTKNNSKDKNSINHKLIKLARPANYSDDYEIKPSINDRLSCFEHDLTISLADDLAKYENILNDNKYYQALKEAKERDAKSAEDTYTNYKEKNPDDTSQKLKKESDRQKKILDSKRAVYSMLEIIQKADPQALESFTISKVVYKLEELGKKINE